MGLNPITLRFGDQREKDFLEYYFSYSLDFVRISLIFSIVFYMLFYALDVIIFPEYKTTFLIIRLVVSFPVAFSIFLLTWHIRFKRFWQLTLLVLVQMAGLGIIIMILFSRQDFQFEYYVGLLLVLMYNYMFSKLRFVWASISGWLTFTFYIISINYTFDVRPVINYMDTFFFASANLFGMMAAYFTEYYTRREFYTIFLLQNEKDKFQDLNLKLEQKVMQRTRALQDINAELTLKNNALNESEEELNRHKTELEKLVNQRTLELQAKYKELEEKNEELKKFNDLFVGREFRIKELRDKINDLESRISGSGYDH